MGIPVISVMGKLFLGGKNALCFPFGCDFKHEAIVVLVELEREVNTADEGLSVTHVLADVGVHEIVPLVEGHCVVNDLLELKGVLILPPSSTHELHEPGDVALIEDFVLSDRVF